MSTIDKLIIRGIRSFGAKAEDEQIITFTSPLTLILGENGCGKTTIIECLKYALTGEMPPGSGKGLSFVHDPKIHGAAECLGQVKLQVKNILGEKRVVTRSLKSGYKRNKPSVESIDATIAYENATTKGQISKRCLDVTTEMCQFMGVSKAIINTVLFCHQEDSSWPLEDGKKLKEKFDAIFGTTEFNKAIDKIIKMRKNEMDGLKIKETDLKFYLHLKKETENKTLELQTAEKKHSNFQETRTKYDNDVKPIEERLKNIFQTEKEIGKLQSVKIELTTKLKNCTDQANALKTKIKKLYDYDLFSLDREIREFREKMSDKRNEKQNFEEELLILKAKERKIQTELSDLERKRTTLIIQRQQEQDLFSERTQKIQELCRNLSIRIDGDIDEANEQQIENVFEQIRTVFRSKEKEVSDLSAAHDKSDHERQTEIDKLREMKAKVEGDILSKNKQKSQLQQDHEKLNREIIQLEISGQKLSALTEKIAKIDGIYENYLQSVDLDKMKNDINDKKENVKKLQEKLERIDEKLTFLNSIAKQTAEINLKTKEFEKRENEIKRVKSKHSDNLKKLFRDKLIDSNYKRTVTNSYDAFQKQINEINRKLNAANLKEKELQTIRKRQREDLIKAEKELTEKEEKIYERCHASSYDELVARTKETVAKLQLDHGAFKSAEAMYKKYIQKIENHPSCPLCHKDMSNSESADLTSELSDEIQRLPENIEQTEKLLKKEQKKYEELLQLLPIIEKVDKLKQDIPKLKQTLKDTEESLGKITDDIESYQLTSGEPKSLMDLASSMFGDMSLLDEALKDYGRIQSELESLTSKLPQGDSSMSVEDAQIEKSTLAAELKNERADLENIQANFEKESGALVDLREKRNLLKDQQIKLQEGLQASRQLKTRREEISVQVDLICSEVIELQTKLEPYKKQLTDAIDNKQKLKDSNRKILNKITESLIDYKKMNHDIERITKELATLSGMNLSQEIGKLKILAKRLLEEQQERGKETATFTKDVEKLKTEIMNQEINERDLKDNRELKILEQDLLKLQAEYDARAKVMVEMDCGKLMKEKEMLNRQREDITEKKGELIGQMGEVNGQIEKLKKELNESQYKDSLKNYRKLFYEVEVTKRIVGDLGKYRAALESAIMKFHGEKMQRINQLIREFWRQIYRGNDIDYIQIQTSDDTVSDETKRRSYDYRVVQSKNGSVIEMKGRCSAGQRVLASLIIRMALAETFSANCGVLALDEPTTNLDRHNIISLCEALTRIVEERQMQSNFMLIVITHDEEFISILGNKTNKYYRVFRNDEGKSVVRKT